jgi:hypothetical protein
MKLVSISVAPLDYTAPRIALATVTKTINRIKCRVCLTAGYIGDKIHLCKELLSIGSPGLLTRPRTFRSGLVSHIEE